MRQLRHCFRSFVAYSSAVVSTALRYPTCARAACSTGCPCPSDADCCLRSDDMPDPRLQALALMAPAVDLELEPGQMSLHDVNLIHGSNPNASPRRRAGVAYRYMPTTSHFDRQLFSSDAASGYVFGGFILVCI